MEQISSGDPVVSLAIGFFSLMIVIFISICIFRK